MSHLLVYNVEPASPSMIRSLDRHCLHRVMDGDSNIDKSRSHMNVVIVGLDAGVQASIDAFFEDGPKPPSKQSEAPYLRIVVSASPSYFRPDDLEKVGTWDHDRMNAWMVATMDQLRSEHGDDLVYAELHLDEDTPHIHAVVVPTYQKKPRIPGRRKRDETEDEFEFRRQIAINAVGVRTAGRSSHPELSKRGSFQRLRERMSVALDHLGIDYGEDRAVDAPDGKSTRQWVKEQAHQLRADRIALDAEKAQLAASQKVNDDDRAALDVRQRKLNAEQAAFSESKKSHGTEVAALAVAKSDFSEFQKARDAEHAAAVDGLKVAFSEIRAGEEALKSDKAEIAKVRFELVQQLQEVETLKTRLKKLLSRVVQFLRIPEVDGILSTKAKTLKDDVEAIATDPEISQDVGPSF